jgi:4-hydroxyproline epimerase
VREFTAYAENGRFALEANRITAADGAEIDPIEVNSASPTLDVDAPGATWRQETILDGLFEGADVTTARGVLPRITGSAHVTAQSTLFIDAVDPSTWGTGATTSDAQA